MTNGTSNGVNGVDDHHRPQTPHANGMSLTEYSANPTTPAEIKRNRSKSLIADEYLLPDGHPDVR